MNRVAGRWTLRRRLVATVLALLAAVAVVMGLASTLALRTSLLDQVDERLTAASERAVAAPQRLDRVLHASGTPAVQWGTTTPAPGTSDDSTGARIPPAFGLPGQDVGTVSVFEHPDTGGLQAAYLDNSGEIQQLTDDQLAALLAVEPDGTPETVNLPGLGAYRVRSVTSDSGDTSVIALPVSAVTATVDQYIAVEVAVTLLGLLAAAWFATLLIRRELRPLDRVAATAARVSEMPLSRGEVDIRERVPDEDTDPATEVGQVGAALNRMLGHVESALTARHESETQVRRFVADASHELRTPLASIRGYAELVQRLPDDLPDDALRAMDRVGSEARRMTSLLEDMLLLARLDAGRDLDLAEVDLAALAVDAVADAHAAGPDHTWRLALVAPAQEPGAGRPAGADRTDPDDRADRTDGADWAARPEGAAGAEDDEDDEDLPPATVLGDEHRLRQVLVNLLSNARVHTPPGTTVVLSVVQDPEHVVLQVRDDGPGIAEPLHSRLFQRFARGDASRNRTAGSTGLGLSIAHAVVAAHGGTIDADGTPGATTFTVRLPRPLPIPMPSSPHLPPQPAPVTPPQATPFPRGRGFKPRSGV